MVTHSSILAWKIPRTEEPGRLQSMGLQRVGHDWATLLHFSLTQQVKNLPVMQETQEMWAQSLGQEDPLKEEMAIHSSVLAWKFSWAGEPGGLQSTGSQRVRHNWTHGMQWCLLFTVLTTGHLTLIFGFDDFFFLIFLSLFPFALNLLKRACALSFKFWNLFFLAGGNHSVNLWMHTLVYLVVFFFITLCSWSLDTIFSA